MEFRHRRSHQDVVRRRVLVDPDARLVLRHCRGATDIFLEVRHQDAAVRLDEFVPSLRTDDNFVARPDAALRRTAVLPDELDIFVPPAAHQRAGHLRPFPQEQGEPVEMRDYLVRAAGVPQECRAAEQLAQHQVSLEQRTHQTQVLHPALQQQELARGGVQRDELWHVQEHEQENVQENVQPSPVLHPELTVAVPQDAPPDLPEPPASPP